MKSKDASRRWEPCAGARSLLLPSVLPLCQWKPAPGRTSRRAICPWLCVLPRQALLQSAAVAAGTGQPQAASRSGDELWLAPASRGRWGFRPLRNLGHCASRLLAALKNTADGGDTEGVVLLTFYLKQDAFQNLARSRFLGRKQETFLKTLIYHILVFFQSKYICFTLTVLLVMLPFALM